MFRMAGSALKVIFLLTSLGFSASSFAAAANQIVSPNGLISLIVAETNGTLTYEVRFKRTIVIEPSPLGLTIDQREIGNNISLGISTSYKVNEMPSEILFPISL